MPARTFKFLGKAYSTTGNVSVTATFNGAQVYSGEVPTLAQVPPGRNLETLDEFFQWVGDTDLSGNIPFTLSVSNGTVFFGEPFANYSGFEATINFDTTPPTWASIETEPVDYWADVNMNTVETDGKYNVTVNGVAQSRVLQSDTEIGDWQYTVPNGATLACDIFIDPNVTQAAIPPEPVKPITE
jgi:hypothetical protein